MLKASLFTLLSLFLLASLNAQAKYKFFCKEANEQVASKQILILAQLNASTSLKEGTRYPFEVELYKNGFSIPTSVARGHVSAKDQLIDFTSDKKYNTFFRLYLDKPTQAYLTVNGKTTYFDCK